MHPELYFTAYQQDRRELDQRLAEHLRHRTSGSVRPPTGSDVLAAVRQLVTNASALAAEVRSRLSRVRTRPAAVECCVAVG